MIRPMPRAVLIHSVEYFEKTKKDRYGNEFKNSIILKNVLVQPASNINSNNVSNDVAYKSLMFFDCTNSIPKNLKFKKLSKIVFNGEMMIINKVNPIYTFGLHHYELELI